MRLEDVDQALLPDQGESNRPILGLCRSYIDYQDDLSCLRGRLNISKVINRPHRVRLPCLFEENTSDLVDNQILVWTLRIILFNGICNEDTEALVRKAFQALRNYITLCAFKPDECLQRLYNRLNSDYLPMHALCRFFLESSGPTHERGERRTLPFLIDMTHLFELFVAEWLKTHIPAGIQVDVQDSIKVGEEHAFEFVIDISLSDSTTGRCLAVLDTKYKINPKPKNEDIYQVVAYAEAKSTDRAILVYPQVLDQPTVGSIGRVHVHTLSFRIGEDLDNAGKKFLSDLFKILRGHG